MPMLSHSRGLSAFALFGLASVLLSAPSHAAFPPAVPEIKFTVNKSAIDFGDVQVQSGATETFRIENDSACAMRLDLGSDVSSDFVTTCSGLTNTDEIQAGSSIGCSVLFSPRTVRPQSKVLSITLSYGTSCGSELHRGLTGHHDELKKPVVVKRDALIAAGPDTQAVDTALKTELLRIATAIDKLKAEDQTLKEDSAEIAKDVKEHLRLSQIFRERISTLNEQWDRLKATGPNFDVVTNLLTTKTLKFEKEDSRLKASLTLKQNEQVTLREQQRVALDELRQSGICLAGCNKTKSEYERSGNSDWEEHTAKAGVRPPTADEVAAKKKEYDDKIAAAASAATKFGAERTELATKHVGDLAEIKANSKVIEEAHTKRLNELQAQVSSVRKDMSARIATVTARIHELRDKAAKRQAAIKKEITALETARTIANADYKGKVAKITRDHATEIAKLDAEITALKTQLAAAQGTLNRNLSQKKTTHVKLSGNGVKP